MDKLFDWTYFLYDYCTDFVINLANLLHLSYYEINFIFFCLLYPMLLLSSLLFYFIQRKKLKRARISHK